MSRGAFALSPPPQAALAPGPSFVQLRSMCSVGQPSGGTGRLRAAEDQLSMLHQLPPEIISKIFASVILKSETMDPLHAAKSLAAKMTMINKQANRSGLTDDMYESFNQILGFYGHFRTWEWMELPDDLTEYSADAEKWFKYVVSNAGLDTNLTLTGSREIGTPPNWLRIAVRNAMARFNILREIEWSRSKVEQFFFNTVLEGDATVRYVAETELRFLLGAGTNDVQLAKVVENNGAMLLAAFKEDRTDIKNSCKFFYFSRKTYELLALLGKGSAPNPDRDLEIRALVTSCMIFYEEALKAEQEAPYRILADSPYYENPQKNEWNTTYGAKESDSWQWMRDILGEMVNLSAMQSGSLEPLIQLLQLSSGAF